MALLDPIWKVVVYYVEDDAVRRSQAAGTMPRIYTSSQAETDTYRRSLDDIKREWQERHAGYTCLACEAWDDYLQAKTASMAAGESSEAFARNRCRWLIKKGKSMIHPTKDELVAMDEVFWVDGDPHPVDGAPTLFVNDVEAKAYARLCFPELGAGAAEKVKRRKVYGIFHHE